MFVPSQFDIFPTLAEQYSSQYSRLARKKLESLVLVLFDKFYDYVDC